MMINHELKPRNAKENPARALCVAVFAMCIVSGLLLLILAFILYTMEPAESVIRIGVVAVYVVAGLVGGILAGKLMREQKFFVGACGRRHLFCTAVSVLGSDERRD